jgi:uncharacterized protein YjiS (DUF1127 family)
MNTTYNTTGLTQPNASTERVSGFFGYCQAAFQEWCKRERLRAELYGLNDYELMDIGITRGEIEHFASNSSIDPHGRGRCCPGVSSLHSAR